MDNKEQVGFSLRKITTEQFAIIENSFDENNNEIELGTGLRFGVDSDKNIIAAFLTINFRQNKNTFLVLESGCHFEIVENAWNTMINNETNEIKIPKGFIGHLVMLTIGTARGILHSKTENTVFNKFLLPTLNVNEMITEDIVIKLNPEKEEQ